MNGQTMKRTLTLGALIFNLLGIGFGVLTFINLENWLYRIGFMGFMAISFLLNGIFIAAYQKKKFLGYLIIGTAIFMAIIMLITIKNALAKGVF